MSCKLSCCHPKEITVEDALCKVVCDAGVKGRPLPRFALLGWHTWKRLRQSLIGTCSEQHLERDFTVATPVGMISIVVDEEQSEGIRLVYFAKDMRPR